MTLEADLRHALADRAQQVPADAGARLAQLDYRPRTRRTNLAVGALAAGAGTTAAIVSLVTLGAGASIAFAGWSSTPTTPSPSQIAAAEAACRTRLAHVPIPPGMPANAQPPVPDNSNLPAALVDTRGPFTFVIFADERNSASCITGPGFASLSGSHSLPPVTLPPDRVILGTAHTSRDGHQYSFAEGHAGSSVTGASLQLTNGRTITATLSHGWFLAWWPGDADIKAALVTTPSGTRTQLSDARRVPPPCPPGATCQTQSAVGGARSHSASGSLVTKAP